MPLLKPRQKSAAADVLIVRVGQGLSDAEITSELLALSQRQKDALTLLIDSYRQDYSDAAPRHADTNNALGMSRENGAAEALRNLITVLSQRWTKLD